MELACWADGLAVGDDFLGGGLVAAGDVGAETFAIFAVGRGQSSDCIFADARGAAGEDGDERVGAGQGFVGGLHDR